MRLHKDSHVDHKMTAAQLAHVLLMFEDRGSFFIETIELPPALGDVPCGLFGPIMGDPPIPSALVEMRRRGDRKYDSRMISVFDPVGTDWIKLGGKHLNTRERCSRLLTVIAGPYKEHACVLYTAFGGPVAPKEPGDLSDVDTEETRAKSIAFWAEHALAF